ncbi:MAG: amidohydrolase [Candidatus Korobacteraceae bacterium]
MKTNYGLARVWPRLLTYAMLLMAGVCAFAQPSASISATHSGKNEFVIKNATLLTATHGRIDHGSVYVKDGKIAAFGANVSAPATVTVIDADGKYVTPGIIDPHSHMALDGDVNEATNPVVPQMMMKDAFEYTDKAIYRALAGGVTTSLLLHGSADMIGGQAVVIKTKYGLDRDQMLFPGAPQSIKFASGENPKRVFGDKKQLPSTRMGNFEVMREAFTQAKDYQRQWDEYNAKVTKGDKNATPPKKDLKMEALVQVLQGKMLVQIHCYRADEFLTEIAIANEFGYKIRAFHHALEAYKVPQALAQNNIAIATFSDWWGFKYEAWDAIPWNAVMAMRAGVRVAVKSDSDDYMRRLNQEAAKTMRYGGATEDEAVQMMTINPAWIIGVDDKTGSIDVGKDADLVLWDGYPLSTYGIPQKVWIDGDVYFDRALPGFGMPQYQEGQ